MARNKELKWRYVVVSKAGSDRGHVNYTPQFSKKEWHDTPEEAFAALKEDYQYVWDDTDYFEFFLKWEYVEVEPKKSEDAWDIQVKHGGIWSKSMTYPKTYNWFEAEAILERAKDSGLEYRKVLA